MDSLDVLLKAQAMGAQAPDPLDAMLSAQANPQSQQASQSPSAPIRYMEPPSTMDRLLAKLPSLPSWIGDRGGAIGRLAMGAADPGVGLVQLGANAIGKGDAVNQRIKDVEQQYQSSRAGLGSTGFDPLRMAGNVGISLMAPGATAASGGSGLLGSMARGAATGAAFNLAQPVTDSNYWQQKAAQGGTGALFGALGVPVSAALASVVKPNTAPAVRGLMDEGINLTPGQILGGGFQRAEDAATSIPVLGDFIRDAKNRSLAGLQQAAYGRALDPVNPVRAALGLAPVDPKMLPPGPQGVLAVKTALSDTYDALLPKLTFDVQTVAPQLAQLSQMASTLPGREAAQFKTILDKNLGQLSGGRADGQTFKDIVSNIGTEAKGFNASTDGYQRKLGDALTQAQAIFRQGLKASNPEFAPMLNAVDAGYGNYAIIRRAAQSAGDKSHGFTPAELSSAVRASDSTVGKGATATGTARMQDLSDPARTVLPSTVSDSGTPLRHAVQAAVGGLVGHQLLPEALSGLMVPAAATVGGLALPYTQIGQRAMQKVLAERPEFATELAGLLRRSGPLLGAATAPGLLGAFPALSQ